MPNTGEMSTGRELAPAAAGEFGRNLSRVLRGLFGASASGDAGEGQEETTGKVVYRQRIYHLIPYGHFDEVLDLCHQLNEIVVRRGGRPASFWIPTVGEQNQLIVEFEFTDLGAYGRGRAASNADPEWTALVRRIGAAVVPGSVHTELWETAPRLASNS
jgi:NIPSNAP